MLIFISVAGISVFYEINLHLAKNEAFEKISLGKHDQPVILAISKDDMGAGHNFRWHDKKEVIFAGRLYDIIDIRESSDTIFFTAVRDIPEEQLMDEFCSVEDSDENDNYKERIRLLLIPCYPDAGLQGLLPTLRLTTESFLSNNYISVIQDIISPPPEFC